MTLLIRSLLASLFDVALAVWHAITGKRRAEYSATVDIRAPRSAVWALLIAQEAHYERVGIAVRLTPIPGLADAVTSTMTVRGREVPSPAFRYVEVQPERRLVVEYLPAYSPAPEQLGTNDMLLAVLADAPGGGTRFTYTRKLTHRRPATRITAPMGVRQGVFLVAQQAEHEAGIATPAPSLLTHFVWTLAAFLSFAWLVGPTEALTLMAVIALHEAGHALAMLRYGLGVSLVGFIPFLGGIAAPARFYENAWQKSVVLLMGVGASLPATLALVWSAKESGGQTVITAAVLFALINGSNLLPLPGLDGGQVTGLLSHHIHPKLSQVLMWLMMAAFVALAVALGTGLIWIAVAFALVHLTVATSLQLDEKLPRMSAIQAWTILAAYLALTAAYGVLTYTALDIDGAFTN